MNENLAKAMAKFPKGTRFKSALTDNIAVSDGKFSTVGHLITVSNNYVIYSGIGQNWATVIEDKPKRKGLF